MIRYSIATQIQGEGIAPPDIQVLRDNADGQFVGALLAGKPLFYSLGRLLRERSYFVDKALRGIIVAQSTIILHKCENFAHVIVGLG